MAIRTRALARVEEARRCVGNRRTGGHRAGRKAAPQPPPSAVSPGAVQSAAFQWGGATRPPSGPASCRAARVGGKRSQTPDLGIAAERWRPSVAAVAAIAVDAAAAASAAAAAAAAAAAPAAPLDASSSP